MSSSPAAPAPATRRIAIRAAQILLGVALVAYLVASDRLEVRRLGQVIEAWPWYLAANLLFLGAIIGQAIRWHLLLRVQAIDIAFARTLSLVLIGICFNQVTPGATGGDIAKAIAVSADHPDRRPAALLSILVDRMIGLGTLLLTVGVFALLLGSPFAIEVSPRLLAAAAGLALAGLALVGLLTLSSRARAALGLDWLLARVASFPLAVTLREAVRSYGRSPGTIALAVACGIAVHMCNVSITLCLVRAMLGTEVALAPLISITPWIHLMSAIPLTPFGNVGVLEATYAQLLAQVGVPDGALIGLLQRSISVAWALVGAVVLVVGRSGRARGTRSSLSPGPDPRPADQPLA